ncbi:tRNA (uracil-5-)-methyltransferase homolog B-like [Glandiceps talaboti]
MTGELRNLVQVLKLQQRSSISVCEQYVKFKHNKARPKHAKHTSVFNPKLWSNYSNDELFDQLSNIVTPLWKTPYHEQLKLKYSKNEEVLRMLTNEIATFEESEELRLMMYAQNHDHVCCPLELIKPSPQTEGYRNKCDFSVGVGYDGYKKTVGFYIGQMKRASLERTAEECKKLEVTEIERKIVPCCRVDVRERSLAKGLCRYPWNMKKMRIRGRLVLSLWSISLKKVRGQNDKFSVADEDSKFYVAHQTEGTVICVRADKCINMNNEHKMVGKAYEGFLRESSLDVMLDFKDGGHWRGCTEELEGHKEHLRNYFTEGAGKECNLTSLYIQESTNTRQTNEEAKYELLYGEPYIYERLLDLKFRISPDSFFQINTLAAEILYCTVKELCQVDCNTTLLDVCCGTGTIGIIMADSVKQVVGVEMINQAVEDARINSALNNIHNAEFITGKAEKVIPQLMSTLEDENHVVAVVNPSRAGLHPKVIRTLRNCEFIRHLVYVSCKPDGQSMRNFTELCCPPVKKLTGTPFTPIKAIPVDMFPHTDHCELVILFER